MTKSKREGLQFDLETMKRRQALKMLMGAAVTTPVMLSCGATVSSGGTGGA
jgi:hypothetical protein